MPGGGDGEGHPALDCDRVAIAQHPCLLLVCLSLCPAGTACPLPGGNTGCPGDDDGWSLRCAVGQGRGDGISLFANRAGGWLCPTYTPGKESARERVGRTS